MSLETQAEDNFHKMEQQIADLTETVGSLKHALKLAREDLWFLIMHTDCCEQYAWRAGGTAEFISKTLKDKSEFEPTLQRWIKTEAPKPGFISEVLTELRSTGLRPA